MLWLFNSFRVGGHQKQALLDQAQWRSCDCWQRWGLLGWWGRSLVDMPAAQDPSLPCCQHCSIPDQGRCWFGYDRGDPRISSSLASVLVTHFKYHLAALCSMDEGLQCTRAGEGLDKSGAW